MRARFLVTFMLSVVLVACGGSATAPSPAPVTLREVQVSMWGFNGTFTEDGAVLLGHTFQMTANARFSPVGGEDVTKAASWESSNPTVAPISPSGLLTGLANGSTVVTATYQGKSGSLVVRVSDIP